MCGCKFCNMKNQNICTKWRDYSLAAPLVVAFPPFLDGLPLFLLLWHFAIGFKYHGISDQYFNSKRCTDLKNDISQSTQLWIRIFRFFVIYLYCKWQFRPEVYVLPGVRIKSQIKAWVPLYKFVWICYKFEFKRES